MQLAQRRKHIGIPARFRHSRRDGLGDQLDGESAKLNFVAELELHFAFLPPLSTSPSTATTVTSPSPRER